MRIHPRRADKHIVDCDRGACIRADPPGRVYPGLQGSRATTYPTTAAPTLSGDRIPGVYRQRGDDRAERTRYVRRQIAFGFYDDECWRARRLIICRIPYGRSQGYCKPAERNLWSRMAATELKLKIEKRPGRDLNPGQKLRRLLGCPLPYRDTRLSVFPLITTLSWLKRIAPGVIEMPWRELQGPTSAGIKPNFWRIREGTVAQEGPTGPLRAPVCVPSHRFRRTGSGILLTGPRRPVYGYLR